MDGLRRGAVLVLLVVVGLGAGSCELVRDTLLPAGPGPTPSPAPVARRPPVGPELEDVGRIRMTGSGFAVTIDQGWIVQVASPDPVVTVVGPDVAWEALRTFIPGRDATCSVYVAVPPAAQALGEDFSLIEHDRRFLQPEWQNRLDGLYLVLPQPVFANDAEDGSGSTWWRVRPPGSHPDLPGGALAVLDCWWSPSGPPPLGVPERLSLLDPAAPDG